MRVRDIEPKELFLLPVIVKGREINGLNTVRAYVPNAIDGKGATFTRIGEMVSSDKELESPIFDTPNAGGKEYAYAVGPVHDFKVANQYNRVQIVHGYKQLWVSMHPVKG